MEVLKLCKLCSVKESKYVCPRCNIPYCSLPCYQSQAHVQCSENFYKECVVEQIKSDELDPESQKKMMEILQRVQQIDGQLEDEEVIDSDDGDSEEELAARLTGVDLDDADSVWEQLTEDERRQFQEMLISGDVTEVIPSWLPWWCGREKKKLVEVLEDGSQSHEGSNPGSVFPLVRPHIEPFSKLSKVSPSPCVRWNVTNVLAAYSVMARVYNGDHQGAAQEAATTLVTLSDNLSNNQLFQSPELAVAGVQLAAVNNNCVVGGVDDYQLKNDVQMLVEGPSETSQSQYVLAALSDIHALLSAAKCKPKDNADSKGSGEFSKRFPNVTSTTHVTSVSALNKYLKKIEFYLSWTKDFF